MSIKSMRKYGIPRAYSCNNMQHKRIRSKYFERATAHCTAFLSISHLQPKGSHERKGTAKALAYRVGHDGILMFRSESSNVSDADQVRTSGGENKSITR
jgi:hypothetical protein